MLTILIIEDNPEELVYCANIINLILGECRILQAESAEKALQFLSGNKIDLFFIDVELPGMDGFQFAETIRRNPDYIMTFIIFLTGYQANQLEIHRKYHHYEYIEKPYSFDSFKQLVEPLLNGLELQKNQNESARLTRKRKMVLIETKGETFFIEFDDMLYVETDGKGLKLHTKQHIFSDIKINMECFIKDVNRTDFIRCHKSYALNINNILKIKNTRRRSWTAYFDEKQNCSCLISQTYYDKIHQQYLKMMGK